MRRLFKPGVGMIVIGDTEVEEQKRDYESIVNGLKIFNIKLFIEWMKAETERIDIFMKELLAKKPDILLIVVLRGMSAQAIKRVAESTPLPCIIWAVRERWAWPSSALAFGALKKDGKKVRLIYGQGDEKDRLDEFRESLQAAFALSKIGQSRIGKIGSLFPNLISREYDETVIKAKLGVEIVEIPFGELRSAMDTVSKNVNAVDKIKSEVLKRFTLKCEEIMLAPGLNLHLALKRIAKIHKLDGFAIECWSRMPKEIGLNPCLGFIEDDYTITCEGDVLTGIAVQIVRYLTGIYPYVGDVYDLDKENILTFVHCGAPASISVNAKSVIIQDSAQAGEQGFPTVVCKPRLKKGEVTILNLYGKGCDYLHLTTGELIETRLAEKMWVKIRLSGDRRRFLEECLANHYVVIPGNIRSRFGRFCEWSDMDIVIT